MKLTAEQAKALARPFEANEIEWRVGQAGLDKNGNPWVRALAYLTSRAVMDRLDEVFGVGGWSHSIREIALGNAVGVICRLEAGDAYHEDVAECSDIEALKGAASGGLKRSAVAFGIGRYLYYLEDGFAKVHPQGRFRHSGEDKRTKTRFECKWDPPALPEWALPGPKDVRINPYAPIGFAPPPSEEQESPTTVDSPLDEAFGLVDEKFAAHVRTLLADTKGVAGLRKAFAAGQAKLLALGQPQEEEIDVKADRFYIAERVLRLKGKIIVLEGGSK